MNHASQKRPPPAQEHLHPPDHLPPIRHILPSAGSAPSLYNSLRINDTPLHFDGAEREKCEGRVSGGVRVKWHSHPNKYMVIGRYTITWYGHQD